MKKSAMTVLFAVFLLIFASYVSSDGAGINYGDTFYGSGADLCYGAQWTAGGGVRQISTVTASAYGATEEFTRVFTSSDAVSHTARCTFEDARNLYLREYVIAEVSVIENPSQPNAEYVVTVTVDAGVASTGETVRVRSDKWYSVAVDLSDFEYRYAVGSVTVTVTPFGSGVDVSGFRVRGIFASGTVDVDDESRFLCREYRGEGCTVIHNADSYVVVGDADAASVSLYGEIPYLTLAQPQANTLRIALTNASDNTALTVSCGGVVSTLAIEPRSDEEVYYVPAKYSQGALLRLEFSGAAGQDGTQIALSSVSFLNLPDYTHSADVDANIGAVSSATRTGSSVRVRGTVTADAAVDYIRGKIELYRLAAFEDVSDVADDAVPLVSVKMSTKFDFTANLALLTDAQQSRFAVAVTMDGERHFISGAFYAMPVPSAQASLSLTKKGLELTDADSVPLNEGLSWAVLDVRCERLVSEAKQSYGNVVLFSRGGSYYYFNRDYTAQLDSFVRELSSTGTRVLLRLVITEEMAQDSLTYGGVSGSEYYAPNMGDSAGVNQWAAVVDYLSSRYSGGEYGVVGGFIIGGAANEIGMNQTGGEIDGDYIRACADAVSLAYNVARSHIADAEIYTAISLGGNEPSAKRPALLGNNYNGANDSRLETALYLKLFYSALKESGGARAGIFALCDDVLTTGRTADELTAAYLTVSSAVQNLSGGDCVGALILAWQPRSDGVAANVVSRIYSASYKALTGVSGHIALNALVMSLPDAGVDYLSAAAAGIRSADADERVDLSAQAAAVDEGDLAKYAGSYVYFDFSSAYDCRGWFAGSGCKSVSTRLSVAAGERVLRAEMNPGEGGKYFMVLFDGIDLRGSPAVVMELAASAETELSVIFGSGSNRTEFTVAAGTDSRRFLMDLTDSGVEGSLRYIMIRADGGVDCVDCVDLTKVSFYSSTLDSGAVKASVVPAAKPNDTGDISRRETAGIIIIASVAAVSIFALALTSRKYSKG